MFQEYKKIMILSSITFIMFLLLLLFLFVDISLGPIQIASISTILNQYDKVTQAEEDLVATQNTHKTTLSVLEKSKKDYQNEKNEYETLSDETIRVIKEATMQEEYSIEYMWIRLGNYAKMYNLSIVLVEPGGSQEADTSNKSNQTNQTTTTNTTNDNNNTSTSTTNNNNNNNTSENVVDQNNNNTSIAGNTNEREGSIFKIQVSGSYMNVSDFVFAVENDNELKFKLDNISMEYLSGTSIKATFDVKNMVIKK